MFAFGSLLAAFSSRPESGVFSAPLHLDVYRSGYEPFGHQILYGLVNRREDAAAERVFAPWHDMEEGNA